MMASSKRTDRRVPPSYEEIMEARRRSEENPKHDPTSPGHGVYRKRTDVDDVGYDEAGTTPQYQSDQPATISHTTVQPQYHQYETTLLPQSSTGTSVSPEPSRGSPKKNRYKKSTSRSTSSSKRDPNTYVYENQQSVDYWSSIEPVTIDPNVEPILMRPMVTRVGPDGRTYLRDTSIVVVQHEDHETPNTQRVVERPTRPNDYMWYSFVGMAFCFFFGIFSLKRSKEVSAKFEAGDYEGAQKSSASARNWGTLALISGALIIIVFIFLLFVSPCPLTRTLQFQGICPEGV